jgi:hypothetical protein
MRLRWRWVAGLAAACIAAAVAVGPNVPADAGQPARAGREGGVPKTLEVFYTPPVLVRAGERVEIPVDVSCATTTGRSCLSRAILGTPDRRGTWRTYAATAAPGLRFDLTESARRSVASSESGSVAFFVRGEGPAGLRLSLPADEAASPLRFYVARDIPVVRIPDVPFGRVTNGRTALSLPWGSGRLRAGIEPGVEGSTIGPSSFDVDRAGRIYLLDGLQGRLAVFDHGRLVRQVGVPATPRGDVAVRSDGTASVLDQQGRSLVVRRIGRRGALTGTTTLGDGILSQVRAGGSGAFVHVVPLNEWVSADADGTGEADDSIPSVAQPVGLGQGLLKVTNGTYLRLGTVRRGRVVNAVELRASKHLGEIALAEPDGGGGYWAVVRIWQEQPVPADQYQVMHVVGAHVVSTFAVPDREFAETAPLSVFRLGSDGTLYQLASFPNGIRILAYPLEGAR